MKKNKIKIKRNILRNLFYSLKIIYKIDKPYIINKFIQSFFSAFIMILYALILRVAIQAIEDNIGFYNMFFRIFGIIAIIYPINLYQRLVSNWAWYREEKIYTTIKLRMSIVTLDMDYELFEHPESQDRYEKALKSINSWGSLNGMLNTCFHIFSGIITFIFACFILSNVSVWLILLISVLAFVKLFIESKNSIREKKEFNDKTPPITRKITYTNNISSNLDIGKDLRIYDMNAFINQERDLAINEYLALNKKNQKNKFIYNCIANFVKLLDTFILYAFLIYEVIYNDMKIADFTFMLASIETLILSLNNIVNYSSNITRNSLEINDYLNFINMDFAGNYDNEINQIDEIEFKDVYYQYYMQEGYVLNGISFKITAKEKIALVGYNGAGKTTIVKLLTGLYHPTKGQILINGIDIETIKRECLQKLISPVFQDCNIYSFTIEENIAMEYGNKVNPVKIKKAISKVDLDNKVNSLENKEKTILTRDLDDKGIVLSGGEIQKLSLARAMYKETSLFIFDEPTSSMDAISEYSIYSNFNDFVREITTIYISHRLSSTRFCDRIIFIDKGVIIESGSHNELMKYNSEYKKLFMMQAKYYKGEEDNEKRE